MKLMKKTRYFLVIISMLFSPLFTFAMNSLQGVNDFEFQEVIDRMVMNPHLTTLQYAAADINQKEQDYYIFGEFINKPNNCLRLIKKLAQRFKSSDEDVCKLLTIPQAQRQLALQAQLEELCEKNKISFEDLKMFQSLIAQGADVNFTTTVFGGKKTPLIQALDSKNSKMVRLLLNTNADPNIGMYQGDTPLTFAIRSRNPEIVASLLEAGADPKLPNLYNKSPLEVAQRKGNSPLAAAEQTINDRIIKMIENKIALKNKN